MARPITRSQTHETALTLVEKNNPSNNVKKYEEVGTQTDHTGSFISYKRVAQAVAILALVVFVVLRESSTQINESQEKLSLCQAGYATTLTTLSQCQKKFSSAEADCRQAMETTQRTMEDVCTRTIGVVDGALNCAFKENRQEMKAMDIYPIAREVAIDSLREEVENVASKV